MNLDRWFRPVAPLLLGAALAALPVSNAFAARPAPNPDTPAANLRITLDELLGAHAVLAQLAMEAGYSGDSDFPALAKALTANTQSLTQAVASLYGPAAGQAFEKIWAFHIQQFVNYVVATKKGDASGQKAALRNLQSYIQSFSSFLAKADPYVSRGAVASDLEAHVAGLLATFQAYARGNDTASARDFVQAYEHMFMTGDYLAGAFAKQFPQKFGASKADTPAANLRATLDMLLAAHAVLAQLAMKTGYEGSRDFSAWVAVLSANTQALSQAVGSVYGASAGQAFAKLWTFHIQQFVDYVVATKKGDSQGQKAALANLEQYRKSFADFLAKANPHISATALADSLQVHVNELVATFKAFVANNPGTAVPDFVAAYDHMFMSGDYLTGAIVAQFPARFGSR